MLSSGDPSGLYNVVTKKPTGVTKAEFTATAGSYDFYRASIDFDGKLDKKENYYTDSMDLLKIKVLTVLSNAITVM